ncbi:MAG: hypothetical protein ACREU8_07240, partial [Gammaproteobacteria bacterium]
MALSLTPVGVDTAAAGGACRSGPDVLIAVWGGINVLLSGPALPCSSSPQNHSAPNDALSNKITPRPRATRPVIGVRRVA